MAGGSSGGSRKAEGGSWKKTRSRWGSGGGFSSNEHRRRSAHPVFTECFVRRRKIEAERTYSRIVRILERDIVRLLGERRNTDFFIIHGCSVLETNGCIVKARSPKLYESLVDERRSVRASDDSLKCYVETPEIFKRIEDFARLLYSNSDVEREERLLVRFCFDESSSRETSDRGPEDRDLEDRPRSFDAGERRSADSEADCDRDDKRGDEVKKLTRSASDMADSGLETGSLSPLENSENNSATDLEESDGVSMDDELRLLAGVAPNVDATSLETSRVRESIDESAASGSGERRESRCAVPNDSTKNRSVGGASSGYYFIDASSLNDDDNNNGDRKERGDRSCGKSTEAEKLSAAAILEKETLVVEIKEADSGESARASPDAGARESRVVASDRAPLPDVARPPPPLIRRNTFELDPNDEKLSVLRQEYERRQGHLLFQSWIPQYSGHRVDGDSCFGAVTAPNEEPASLDSPVRRVDPWLLLVRGDDPIDPTISSGAIAETGSDDGSRNDCCNSLPVTLNERRASSSVDGWTRDRTRRDEEPAGGRTVDSPDGKIEPSREITAGDDDESTLRVSVPPMRMTNSVNAACWIVDMSDCGRNVSTAVAGKATGNALMSKSFSSSSDCVTNRKNGRRTSGRGCGTKQQQQHSSLGFFVNLNDIGIDEDTGERKTEETRRAAETGKHSCEFFVDLSNEGRDAGETANGEAESEYSGESSDGRKNIFSMFIDLREPTVAPVASSEKDPPKIQGPRLSSGKLTSGDLSGGESSGSSQLDQSGQNSCGSGAERGKASVFMFIESDSPVVRRRALSSSRPAAAAAAFQRHSWNVAEKCTNRERANTRNNCPSVNNRREHKRAHSVSVDRTDLGKLQTKSSNSSHSLSEVARADDLANNGAGSCPLAPPKRPNDRETSSGRNTDTSTEEVFEYDARDTPPNSHVEILVDRNNLVLPSRSLVPLDDEENDDVARESPTQQRLVPPETAPRDAKIYEDECSEISVWEKTGTESTTDGNAPRKSETFDISSSGGGGSSGGATSGVSPDQTDNNDCFRSQGEISATNETPEQAGKIDPIVSSRRSTSVETKRATSCSSFVRLSDLDEAPAAPPLSSSSTGASGNVAAPKVEDNVNYRMSNSIPETSWVESKLALNRNDPPLTARLFPRQYPNVMSTSLPSKEKSPIEEATEATAEAMLVSESDLSSMQSSMGRSGADASTEETETWSMGAATKPYNRLGEDLLRMFLEEINPDVTIDVAGRKIRAHKCILSSRCQYFAAILSGGWIESAGNLITLQGYSYNAVHFALCHIYSGESNIPESLSIVELATLADMLCLEGLKEVIGYTLKAKYCHFFHKPCQVCAVGVLECMPLAAAYGLDEVYRKSLRWITRHFVRIWPCKAFASLPRQLMDKCFHQHILHMSTDNVLQTMMDCDKLLATLPNVRWAEPVFRMVSNLLETAVKYVSDHFSALLDNESFQALGRDLAWNISRLEDNFLAAADRLAPDQACKSYAKLNKMLTSVPDSGAVSQQQQQQQPGKPPWGPLFLDFLRKIQTRVEKCLVKEASRAARTTTWLKMDLELRRRIQELACLVILPHEALKRPSRHSNFLKEPRVPGPSARTPAPPNLDLRRVKVAISESGNNNNNNNNSGGTPGTKQRTGTTSAPGIAATQNPKKSLPAKPRSDPLERKNPRGERDKRPTVADSSGTVTRPKSWPNKPEVKSRYLEPRNKSVPKEQSAQQSTHRERVIVQQRRKIMISSSDSSRTSSPAMKRAVDKKPLANVKSTMKKDPAKALSSDSLADATSDRSKLPDTSKSCGITRPESPSLEQKDSDVGLSADSLAAADPNSRRRAESATRQLPPTRQAAPPVQRQQRSSVMAGKQQKKQQPMKIMDAWMSSDSLMGEIGVSSVSPKSSSNQSNKVSPTMGRTTAATAARLTKAQSYDNRAKKSSPPMQSKSASSATAVRRLPRSLECSTAASRNRAAAISAYHGSPNLRRNLLDAAKTPDLPAASVKIFNGPKSSSLATSLASNQSTSISKREKGNQPSPPPPRSSATTDSPSKRRSPKSNNGGGANVVRRMNGATAKKPIRVNEDVGSGRIKCNQRNGEQQPPANKQPTVGSRSGTFLKDEPTVLSKSDIKTAQMSAS